MCIKQWLVFEYEILSESEFMAHCHIWMAVPLNPLASKGH